MAFGVVIDDNAKTITFNTLFCNTLGLGGQGPEETSYFLQEVLDKLNSDFQGIADMEILFERSGLPSIKDIQSSLLPATTVSVANIVPIEGNKTIDITFLTNKTIYIPVTNVGEKVTVTWIREGQKSLVFEKKDNHIYEVTESDGRVEMLDLSNDIGQIQVDNRDFHIQYFIGSLVVRNMNPEKKGDMDDDNDIDLADVEILASYLAHIDPIRTNADSNPLFQMAGILDEQRDNITISDLTILISFLEGLVELPQ